jgi:hypothetical protein
MPHIVSVFLPRPDFFTDFPNPPSRSLYRKLSSFRFIRQTSMSHGLTTTNYENAQQTFDQLNSQKTGQTDPAFSHKRVLRVLFTQMIDAITTSFGITTSFPRK